MATATGETPPELLMPDLEPGSDVLWATFMQLHASRGSTGMGPAAINTTDLVSWKTLTGVDLNPWEIEVIQALDRVALKAAADQQAKQK